MSQALKVPKLNGARDRRRGPRSAPGFGSRKGQKRVEGLTKSELISKYGPKVRMIARNLAQSLPQSVDIDDLVSAGFMGLMDAADRFDPNRGIKFETFAAFRVRGAMIDELRNQDWIPRTARDRAKAIDRAHTRLESVHGRPPTENEVSAELGMTREAYQKDRRELGSLVLVSNSDPGVTSEIESRTDLSGDLDSALGWKLARNELDRLISALNPDERLVISCYYFRELTLREISEVLRVSESRASQLHSRAITKLRERVRKNVQEDGLFLLLLAA